jgi:aminopeptidase
MKHNMPPAGTPLLKVAAPVSILQRYAQLLVGYCLEITPGDKLYVRSTFLGEPLVREVYREAMRRGAVVETAFEFKGEGNIFLETATEAQLDWVSPFYEQAMREFNAYLLIRAPYNLREAQNVDAAKRTRQREAHATVNELYFKRTATRDLKRCLCQFPTDAAAQEAGMSLEEYENFVFGACKLFHDSPERAWQRVRQQQQSIVDVLNARTDIHYRGPGIDLRFSTKGRKWINSDGQTNMPSGEVYTSPVEDSVNGMVRFTYPAVYMGHVVEGVTLWVKDGYIIKWEARHGQKFLDEMLAMKGARRFGEAAIGTNYDIKQFTRNILFDEKIGGTVHLALGQSYLQAGGRNESSIHWDMIADMCDGGEIFADGERIYANGQMLL